MNDEEIELILLDAGEKMEGAVSHARRVLDRTGRASSALFERLTVGLRCRDEAAGACELSVPEARRLIVTPHDIANLDAIEKAIINSNMGLSPSNDGRIIRLSFPMLTEERRAIWPRSSVAWRRRPSSASTVCVALPQGNRRSRRRLRRRRSRGRDATTQKDDFIGMIDVQARKKKSCARCEPRTALEGRTR